MKYAVGHFSSFFRNSNKKKESEIYAEVGIWSEDE